MGEGERRLKATSQNAMGIIHDDDEQRSFILQMFYIAFLRTMLYFTHENDKAGGGCVVIGFLCQLRKPPFP